LAEIGYGQISCRFELHFLLTKWADFLLPKPGFQALEMEFVLAVVNFSDDLAGFVISETHGTPFLTRLLYLYFRESAD
jgi:hypothetical protein